MSIFTQGQRRGWAPAMVPLVAAMMPLPALAEAVLEEIVVTARKKSENLQDVPISVYAKTGASLQKSGIGESLAIDELVPNLEIKYVSTSEKLIKAAIPHAIGRLSRHICDAMSPLVRSLREGCLACDAVMRCRLSPSNNSVHCIMCGIHKSLMCIKICDLQNAEEVQADCNGFLLCQSP